MGRLLTLADDWDDDLLVTLQCTIDQTNTATKEIREYYFNTIRHEYVGNIICPVWNEDLDNKVLEKNEDCEEMLSDFPLLSDPYTENGAVTCDPEDELIIKIINRHDTRID